MTDSPAQLREKSLALHEKLRGKIQTFLPQKIAGFEDLALLYSPGVAAPCLEIAENPEKVYDFTGKWKTVAVVSDGSAVLGLGNIGGLPGLPVMEGKAALFSQFAGVNAVPIVLDAQNPEKIVETVAAIAPSFGGINLEDIKAPECFRIEEELKKRLKIPVFHDDQHGTAIVTLAGLRNALTLVGKNLAEVKIVMAGAGAAGIAIWRLLKKAGAKNIVLVDSRGAIRSGRDNLNEFKKEFVATNLADERGELTGVLRGADVFVGVSQPNLFGAETVREMAENPILFAMANPDPEILPAEAMRGGAAVVATGRSDFPNQVNNLLAFPGIFKGALANRVAQITDEHKIAAAKVLAEWVGEPSAEKIIPGVFEEGLADAVAAVVR